MAQVKFNRGQRSNILDSLTIDNSQVSFAYSNSSDFDSVYLGKNLVGTSLLRLMNPSLMMVPLFGEQSTTWTPTTPSSNTSLVITADYGDPNNTGTSSPFTTARTLINETGVKADGYEATDSQILTAAATVALVDSVAGDTYHTNGGFGGTYTMQNGVEVSSYTDNWYQYRALSNTSGINDLVVTLPVETQAGGGIQKHGEGQSADYSDTLIPTSKAVAEFFSSVAGGMRYKGGLSLSEATTTTEDYQSGDVFIASEAIPAINAEANDMVVVKAPIATGGSFSSSNCNVFERNLDGAVTKSPNDLTTYGVVYATGTSVVQSTATGQLGQILVGQGLAAPTWLALGTEGQTLMVKNTAQSGNPVLNAQWADTIYYSVESGTNSNVILVKKFKNGALDTTYGENGILTITIDDVDHATNADKVLEKAQTANTDRNLLVGYASTGGNSDATEYKDVEYNPVVTVNNAGQITAQGIVVNEYDNGTYTSNTSINVSESLTWHDIQNS